MWGRKGEAVRLEGVGLGEVRSGANGCGRSGAVRSRYGIYIYHFSRSLSGKWSETGRSGAVRNGPGEVRLERSGRSVTRKGAYMSSGAMDNSGIYY